MVEQANERTERTGRNEWAIAYLRLKNTKLAIEWTWARERATNKQTKKNEICVKFHKHEKLSSKLCWLHLIFFVSLFSSFYLIFSVHDSTALGSLIPFHSPLYNMHTQSLRFLFALYCCVAHVFFSFTLSLFLYSLVFCLFPSSLTAKDERTNEQMNERKTKIVIFLGPCWPFWHTHCLLLFCSFSISTVLKEFTLSALVHTTLRSTPVWNGEKKKKHTLRLTSHTKYSTVGINNVCNCMHSRFF